jgi:hypothetical protein
METVRGITLRGLYRLQQRLHQLAADAYFAGPYRNSPKDEAEEQYESPGIPTFDDITTRDLVYRWIKDASVTGEERLADCPDLVDPNDVRPPTYFVSHAWYDFFSCSS